jgi:HK97 family phage prohead protease
MADTEIERRTIVSEATIEHRDAENGEKQPVIVGYAAVFQSESRNLGGFVETIHPNAFDEVLATKPDVLGVFNHDKNLLLGRTSNNRLKLWTDPYGLRYEITPNPNTSVGRDVIEWVKDRTVVGSSFAFAIKRVGGDAWGANSNGYRHREIRQVSLLEDVGPVSRPAYEASSVVVSRRAIEMALGDNYRPNQTMANAARKGLRAARGRDDVDQRLLAVAERLVGRDILSVEEVEFLASAHQRCHEVRSFGWNGSPAWVEWMLAGGDAGEKWVQRRSVDPASQVQQAEDSPVQIDHETTERAEPDELAEGDIVSWVGGVGRVEHVMRNGSIQGMTATEEAPLAVVTPYDDGEPEDYMVAVAVSELTKMDEMPPADPEDERAVSLRPTASMASAARRGLKLHEEGKSGDGLKPETVARANKISRREELTPEHVREMNAWFARHESASKSPGWNTPGEEKPGYVAWLLWAGDPGQEWSARKVAQMENERSAVAEVEAEATVAEAPQQPVEEPAPAPQIDPIDEAKVKLAELKASVLRTRLQTM